MTSTPFSALADDNVYDPQQARSPLLREKQLMAALPELIARAQATPGWRQILKGVDASAITSRAALASLPVTHKADLLTLQEQWVGGGFAEHRPFAGLTHTPSSQLRRIFMSPGPIFDPEGGGADWWRFAPAFHAAGVRAGDIIHNAFAYHLTPAAFMVEGAAQRLQCPVIPAGSGQSELQVAAIAQIRPRVYVGTPSFLKILFDKADQVGADCSSLAIVLVSGEALSAVLLAEFERRGLRVAQIYATADLGAIAYQTFAGGQAEPGLLLEESLILEIVDPGSGKPVAPGEVGEVVITSFNPDYPMVRFATGDLSAELVPGVASRYRNVRIKGWLGRADQTTKVRGMFVHPVQVQGVLSRHPQIKAARLLVYQINGQDSMELHCVLNDPAAGTEALQAAVQQSIRDRTQLRGDVRWVEGLPGDGKVIEDRRQQA